MLGFLFAKEVFYSLFLSQRNLRVRDRLKRGVGVEGGVGWGVGEDRPFKGRSCWGLGWESSSLEMGRPSGPQCPTPVA